MQQEELEALSREAAKALPKNWRGNFGVLWQYNSEHSAGKFVPHGVPEEYEFGLAKWLYESTEACTEILVRVLLPAEWMLVGENKAGGDPYCLVNPKYAPVDFEGDDPMCAFCVACLQALVANSDRKHKEYTEAELAQQERRDEGQFGVGA